MPYDIPTPRVPTKIPNTSASRAFCTATYLRMSSLLVRADSSCVIFVLGSYEYTLYRPCIRYDRN
jgi:hypothetical protein